MEQEPRKATDVLLSLENKVETLLSIIRSQELNIKVLSNKLNSVMEKLSEEKSTQPKFSVEAVNTSPVLAQPKLDEKNLYISSEEQLPVEKNPTGFRRTSRPETFSGDDMYLNRGQDAVAFPVQVPKNVKDEMDIVVPDKALNVKPTQVKKEADAAPQSVPVIQRIVDKNGKSVFLADVEIINKSTGEQIYKTRTNGTGKWMASLAAGAYKISIIKREAVTKDRIQVNQEIIVDGKQSPFELETLIIKK